MSTLKHALYDTSVALQERKRGVDTAVPDLLVNPGWEKLLSLNSNIRTKRRVVADGAEVSAAEYLFRYLKADDYYSILDHLGWADPRQFDLTTVAIFCWYLFQYGTNTLVLNQEQIRSVSKYDLKVVTESLFTHIMTSDAQRLVCLLFGAKITESGTQRVDPVEAWTVAYALRGSFDFVVVDGEDENVPSPYHWYDFFIDKNSDVRDSVGVLKGVRPDNIEAKAEELQIFNPWHLEVTGQCYPYNYHDFLHYLGCRLIERADDEDYLADYQLVSQLEWEDDRIRELYSKIEELTKDAAKGKDMSVAKLAKFIIDTLRDECLQYLSSSEEDEE